MRHHSDVKCYQKSIQVKSEPEAFLIKTHPSKWIFQNLVSASDSKNNQCFWVRLQSGHVYKVLKPEDNQLLRSRDVKRWQQFLSPICKFGICSWSIFPMLWVISEYICGAGLTDRRRVTPTALPFKEGLATWPQRSKVITQEEVSLVRGCG